MIRRIAPWLGLLAASILLWQVRFKAVSHPVNGDVGFEQGLSGWIVDGGSNGLRVEDGIAIARFARPAEDGEFSSAGIWLGALSDVRYLRVEVEAKWRDVIGGNAIWARPRLVLVTRNQEGRIVFPLDHGAYLAYGSRDWHREDVIFELTPEMHDIGLTFQMLGQQGQMEARRFRVTALQRRPWVPAATVLLLAGWAAGIGNLLRGREHTVAAWRAFPTAAMIVACAWFVVFPGPRMQSRSMLGTFVTGTPDPVPTEVAGTPPTQDTSTAAGKPGPSDQPAAPDQTGSGKPGVPPPSAIPPTAHAPSADQPPPAKRNQPVLTKGIRRLDYKTNVLHIGAFFVLATGVFLATGVLDPWRLLIVIGFLSEAVPNWHNRQADAADILDLTANLSGVALAAGAFVLLARLRVKYGPFLPGSKRTPPDANEPPQA